MSRKERTRKGGKCRKEKKTEGRESGKQKCEWERESKRERKKNVFQGLKKTSKERNGRRQAISAVRR